MANALTSPQIDQASIRSFCDCVFGYLDGPVTIRLIGEKGTRDQKPVARFTTTSQIADLLVRIAPDAASQQRATFIVPATLRPGMSAKAEDIRTTGVVLVDLDAGDIAAKREHLVLYLGMPSMEVASGGQTEEGQDKLHLYWRLSEAASDKDLEMVSRINGAIAAKVGGDTSFKTISQPIRVAGTIHGKYGNLSLVRLISRRKVEYHLVDLMENVEAMPQLERTSFAIDVGLSGSIAPSPKVLGTMHIRAGGKDELTRYSAISKVIGHWIRQVRAGNCSLHAAWIAVDEYNAALIQPSWDEQRLRRDFQAILKLDIAKHGPMLGDSARTEVIAPELSEDALAERFISHHGEGWHHVPLWGTWFAWTGSQWRADALGRVFQAIRMICRTAAHGAKPQDARKVASTRTIQAVQKIVAHDPSISLGPDAFDLHLMLLNTPAGIVDLETGGLEPHDSGLLLTQITRSSLGSGCPQWLAFLDTVTGGDKDLQAYLARVAGYCLSGSTREQAFFFFYGSGANGKSVFLQTLAWAVGDYAATAAADTFTGNNHSRHLTELAGLRAARLVIVTETEAGQGWAEARIKTVTGGEKVRANFMHKDHFEFTPQFKLLVAGNHRPTLGEVGEAMRRRLHVIPFTITIPPQARNVDLAENLKAEADGILGWMLAGCADWQVNGLMPPAIVTGAALEYLASEDHIGQWIEECCEVGANVRAAAKILFASWSDWAKTSGFEVGSARSLGEQLRSRGFSSVKVKGGRGWYGLALHHPCQDRGNE